MLIHGNYCGIGNRPGTPPVDLLDAAQVHGDVGGVGDGAKEADAVAIGGKVEVLGVVGAVEEHHVVAALALDHVAAVALVPLERVVASAADQIVVAPEAKEEVVAVAADERVVPAAASEGVVAGLTVLRELERPGRDAGRIDVVVAAPAINGERVAGREVGHVQGVYAAGVDSEPVGVVLCHDEVLAAERAT